jgi:hypothetical protein
MGDAVEPRIREFIEKNALQVASRPSNLDV